MRRSYARIACAVALATATAVFAGTALAGGGDKSAPAHKVPKQQSGGGHDSKHDQTQSAQKQSSQDQPGVKPSESTDKSTSCTTGSGTGGTTCTGNGPKPDSSKQYGNGKTAAQIAATKGAPSGTQISGPGNSQPHKICGRDVHAYKGGSCEQKQAEQKPAKQVEQKQVEQKVTVPMVSFCDMESATTGKLETKPATKVIGHELDGKSEEARDIVPTFTVNGQTYSQGFDANGQAIFNNGCTATAAAAAAQAASAATTTAATTTTTTTAAAATTTPSVAPTTTSSVVATTAPQQAATTPTTTSAGAVLGAQASLPKSHHAGGVLGAVAGATLPFTGFPLWAAVLIALALVAAGLTLRRRGAAHRL